MKTSRVIYHLMRADFLERVRRYSFLITLGFTIYMGYVFSPPNHASYTTVSIGGHRGIYNSAWMGSVTAMMASVFLSLAGFYIVKNTVDRDEQTRVGQIIAGTPISKPLYILGKTLSNFAVLSSMTAILVVAGAAMQILRAEDTHLHPWTLIYPSLLLTLPVMFLVSATAVLFEVIPGLRRGFGNVVFFFLWIIALSSDMPDSQLSTYNDILGQKIVFGSMMTAAEKAYPDFDQKTGAVSMGFSFKDKGQKYDLTTFRWDGFEPTAGLIWQRIYWLGVGCLVSLFASLFFHRFDPSWFRLRLRLPRGKARKVVQEEGVPLFAGTHLSRMTFEPRSQFLQLLSAELRLMAKGFRWSWYIVALGLMITSLFVPMQVAHGILLPILWIWPLTMWSSMGCREIRHRAEGLIFSAPHSLRRQLPALWMAGALISILLGSGVGLRLLAGGDWGGLFGWLIGAMFIPAMALALGIWSGSSKLFEILYLLLWYLGAMNHAPFLDYTGASAAAGLSIAFSFLVVTTVLMLLAFTGRSRQLQTA